MIQNDTLKQMLEKQEEVNIKFNGTNWKSIVNKENIKLAIITELSELLESSPENWKFWRTNLTNDLQNQYVEFVDVIHFSFFLMMLEYEIEELVQMNYLQTIASSNNSISKSLMGFIEEPYMKTFYELLYSISNKLELDFDKTINLYFDKAELNIERVDKGYKDGSYDKCESGEEDNRRLQTS